MAKFCTSYCLLFLRWHFANVKTRKSAYVFTVITFPLLLFFRLFSCLPTLLLKGRDYRAEHIRISVKMQKKIIFEDFLTPLLRFHIFVGKGS